MAQVLYRKWRPQQWDEVVGQAHVVQTLRNAVAHDHLAHAYLFAGPRGTGKTTTARLLAKAANCLAESPADRPDNTCEHCLAVNQNRFLDLIEIDAASNTSVDDVRDLRDRINFAPNLGRFKVYIVDEVHMLSTAAFNALLKTLEEPPPHAIFVLATTEVQKIPATVMSRCQRHEFRRLSVEEMSGYLTAMVEREGFAVEPEALQLIARQATGSLRDAVSLLDQLVSMGERVTVEQARQVLGLAGHAAVSQLVQALADDQVGAGLALIHQAMDGGTDPRQLARQTVVYLRGVLLTRLGSDDLPEISPQDLTDMAGLAERMDLQLLLRGMRAFSEASRARTGSWQPGLPLELALLQTADVGREPAAGERPDPAAPPAAKSPRRGRSSRAKEAAAPSSEEPAERDTSPPAASEPGAMREQPERKYAAPDAEQDPTAPAVGFQAVLDSWDALMEAVFQRNPSAQGLLNSSKPLGMERGALILGFQSDLLREKMEKGHNLDAVRDSLEQVSGGPLRIRCVLLKDWERDLENVSTPPPMQEDGMVATALRDLGAQLVDVREEEE